MLFAFRQFHNHLMILALRSTIDGSSTDEDEPPDFLPPPTQNPSALLLPPFTLTPLPPPLLPPPLTEPTELFESPKHTCDPVSESFFTIDLQNRTINIKAIVYLSRARARRRISLSERRGAGTERFRARFHYSDVVYAVNVPDACIPKTRNNAAR